MKMLRLIGRTVRRMVWETAMDNTTGLAAQMAYQLLFTLAPGLLFLWHLLGLFGTDPAKLHRMFVILKEFLPPDPKVQDILDSASGQRGCDRLERMDCERRELCRDLSRHHVYQHGFARP